MSNVHRLGSAALPGDPDEALISELEGLLAAARAGELQGLAFCTALSSASIGTGWVGAAGTRYALGMGISILAARYPLAVAEQN